MEIEQALKIIRGLEPISKTENLDISQALGRVLAQDIKSPIDLPLFDKSPLDGFAFRAEDSAEGARLEVIEELCAGYVAKKPLGPGQCTRIMTGAKLPEGATTVCRLESVEVLDGQIVLDATYEPYSNFIHQGEELKKGSLVFKKGRILNAIDLGSLANLGIGQVEVYRQLRIGLISTGSELIPYNEKLTEGKIFNSNSITLSQRLKELGVKANVVVHIDDELDLLTQGFKDLSKDLDLIISTGGVSVGDADYIERVYKRLGAEKVFAKVSMKPGGHILCYKNEDAVFLGLSGNPFAALATFEVFAREIIGQLSRKNLGLKKTKATCQSPFPKRSKARRLIRAIYEDRKVSLPKSHESGQLFSASDCNALVDIKAGSGPVEPGDEVEVFLL